MSETTWKVKWANGITGNENQTDITKGKYLPLRELLIFII
jgi:hypothetical protein